MTLAPTKHPAIADTDMATYILNLSYYLSYMIDGPSTYNIITTVVINHVYCHDNTAYLSSSSMARTMSLT